MYPIRFENLYYEKLWGGIDLESFRSNMPEGEYRRKLGYSLSS